MGLSGLEIYKHLPKKNCKECGFPTCLAFAMQLAAKKVDLSKCPYVTEEAKEILESASQPPIKLVTIGTGENKLEVGKETVMFRHEETFYHPTGIGFLIEDSLTLEEIEKRRSSLSTKERILYWLKYEFFAVLTLAVITCLAYSSLRSGLYKIVTQFLSIIFVDYYHYSILNAGWLSSVMLIIGGLTAIFGGILRCDVLARGVLAAAQRTHIRLPLIIRLEGTNVEEGRKILENDILSRQPFTFKSVDISNEEKEELEKQLSKYENAIKKSKETGEDREVDLVFTENQ